MQRVDKPNDQERHRWLSWLWIDFHSVEPEQSDAEFKFIHSTNFLKVSLKLRKSDQGK